MAPVHTSKAYEQELTSLRDKLLKMGGLVADMMRDATQALGACDGALARSTRLVDRRVNRHECEIDDLAMKILATRQPVASDLRLITSSLKIVTDLERIGDLCVNICDRVVELSEQAQAGASAEILALADEAHAIVRDALDVLAARDAARATELLARDAQIDEHYAKIFKQILDTMAGDPSSVYWATRVQSVAKYLERIADHAMNVAENVVFLVHGRDIRHPNRTQESERPPSSGES